MKSVKIQKASLESKRPTFFLVGLVIVLLGVYGLLNLRVYATYNPGVDLVQAKGEPETFMVNTYRKPPEEKKQERKEIKKETKKALASMIIQIGNGNLEDLGTFGDEPLDTIEAFGEESNLVIDMYALDKKPIFPGCENILDEQERFDCFKQQVVKFVANNMKTCKSAYGVFPEKLMVGFIIDRDGRVTGAEILRGEDDCNKNNALQVINKLPDMQPGMYMGKPVKTRFILPINIRQN